MMVLNDLFSARCIAQCAAFILFNKYVLTFISSMHIYFFESVQLIMRALLRALVAQLDRAQDSDS